MSDRDTLSGMMKSTGNNTNKGGGSRGRQPMEGTFEDTEAHASPGVRPGASQGASVRWGRPAPKLPIKPLPDRRHPSQRSNQRSNHQCNRHHQPTNRSPTVPILVLHPLVASAPCRPPTMTARTSSRPLGNYPRRSFQTSSARATICPGHSSRPSKRPEATSRTKGFPRATPPTQTSFP